MNPPPPRLDYEAASRPGTTNPPGNAPGWMARSGVIIPRKPTPIWAVKLGSGLERRGLGRNDTSYMLRKPQESHPANSRGLKPTSVRLSGAFVTAWAPTPNLSGRVALPCSHG
jgi:hypothetical protein